MPGRVADQFADTLAAAGGERVSDIVRDSLNAFCIGSRRLQWLVVNIAPRSRMVVVMIYMRSPIPVTKESLLLTVAQQPQSLTRALGCWLTHWPSGTWPYRDYYYDYAQCY